MISEAYNTARPPAVGPATADTILANAAQHLRDRAASYDKEEGRERSIPKVTAAFSALTGIQMTEEQGWLFMILLKLARSQQGDYKPDNYEDLAAYSALMGEEAARGN